MNSFSEQEQQIIDEKIVKFMSNHIILEKITELIKDDDKIRLEINLDRMRDEDPDLVDSIMKYPLKVIPMFNNHLNTQAKELKGEKIQVKDNTLLAKKEPRLQVAFTGMLGKHLVSPRGLTAELANQFVGVQGIVTRVSLVRPKLVFSAHYCEATKQGSVKEYSDQFSLDGGSETNTAMIGNIQGKAQTYMSNAVPTKDINSNPLTFEYGFSKFKNHQVVIVQEPPERTPVGQLPRSVEVILETDLANRIKPGDRIQVNGVFTCVSTMNTSVSGYMKTCIVATSVQALNSEVEQPQLTGEDIRNFNTLAKKKKVVDILANSISPGIYGHELIKKALILQLLGGTEKNLTNGTHLRGDINILMIGDPSTAKSQFLRHVLSIAPNAINTTGRGSSGVGLTAAVVVDPDTGDRHLEAGAMVLGDRGIVCIDEFDKMSELDRVAIHEVMEQQTVTIAKAGIHVSLNSRCSVLAAANPIYGQYIPSLPAGRNIGFPDSLLSRFDLCFIVLDEQNSELDRRISDRVISNHMYSSDVPSALNANDDKVIEPEVDVNERTKTHMYEKYNPHLHGKDKKDILTRDFLRKYLFYAKSKLEPVLTNEAAAVIQQSWTKLRERESEDGNKSAKAVPITVRTLETLIRLSTAHAKARLSNQVIKEDCLAAFELLGYTIYSENINGNDSDNEMEIDDDVRRRKAKEEEDEYEGGGKGKSKKKRKGKKEETNELDELLKAKPEIEDESEIFSEETMKYVYKILYDNVSKDYNSISLDDLWNVVKGKSEAKKTHKINNRNVLLDVLFQIEKEGKIFISEDKEITIV